MAVDTENKGKDNPESLEEVTKKELKGQTVQQYSDTYAEQYQNTLKKINELRDNKDPLRLLGAITLARDNLNDTELISDLTSEFYVRAFKACLKENKYDLEGNLVFIDLATRIAETIERPDLVSEANIQRFNAYFNSNLFRAAKQSEKLGNYGLAMRLYHEVITIQERGDAADKASYLDIHKRFLGPLLEEHNLGEEYSAYKKLDYSKESELKHDLRLLTGEQPTSPKDFVNAADAVMDNFHNSKLALQAYKHAVSLCENGNDTMKSYTLVIMKEKIKPLEQQINESL